MAKAAFTLKKGEFMGNLFKFKAAFILFIQLTTAYADVSLFDTIELIRPTDNPKTIYVFSDIEFSQACKIEYWLEAGKIKTQKSMIYGPEIVKPAFKNALVSVTTWKTSVPLCTENMIVRTNSANQLVLAAEGPADTMAHIITIDQESFSMRERSPEVMTAVMGGEAFRNFGGAEAQEAGLKLNQYFSLRFDEFFLKDYSKLNFSVDATPVAINVKTNCYGTIPDHPYAQKCYDSNIHASQYRMALGNATWKDPRCKKRDEADPICKFYGDFLYMTMQLHDERREFFDDNSFFQDPMTGSWIYRVNMRNYLPSGTTVNPFKIVGQRTLIQGDLLALLKNAILKAESFKYLPPRLQNPTTLKLETDEEYIAHYSLSAANLGYEVSGVSGITYKINQFKFSGLKK